MELEIKNVDPITVEKNEMLAKKHDQSWQQSFKKLVHTLAIFS